MPERPIWFDFENTPHVLFLEPMLRHLESRGIGTVATARPQAQTLELAAERHLPVTAVGRGDLTGRVGKVVGGLSRGMALAGWCLRAGRASLLVSSSRTAAMAAGLLRIPSVGLMDYEHSSHAMLARFSQAVWMPDLLRDARLPAVTRRVARFFPGLKENLYLDEWPMDPVATRRGLALAPGARLVVARPPATSAHYAVGASLRYWLEAVRGLLNRGEEVEVIVLARSAAQRSALKPLMPTHPRIRIPEGAVVGPDLIAAADLVLSGGGTMNREAAVLGVPAWSVFAGPEPHIDRALAMEGRLRLIRSEGELHGVLSEPWPPRGSRRGPFPEGLAGVLADLLARLSP